MTYNNITKNIKSKNDVNIPFYKLKIAKWFVITNATVLLTMIILSGACRQPAFMLIFLFGAIFPFFQLFFSKFLAKNSHDIEIIGEDIQGEKENELVEMINAMSAKVGISNPPEVGIYQSEDMNAFATGFTKNSSLIAFSSGLLNKMDSEEISAVAAHEIAHIANGDMITMTLIQSAVNIIVMLCTIPLKIYYWFSDDDNWIYDILLFVAEIILSVILMFLGNLVVKAFSRRREFEADKLASEITSNNYMINALTRLNEADEVELSQSEKANACFKISAEESFLDIFSTHPSLERRIKALKQ